MKPAIITLLPVRTFIRVEMLARRGGLVLSTTGKVSVDVMAGANVVLPATSAKTVHVPTATPLTVPPAETMHTPGLPLENVAARPELVVAVTVVLLPVPSDDIELNVTVCGSRVTPAAALVAEVITVTLLCMNVICSESVPTPRSGTI